MRPRRRSGPAGPGLPVAILGLLLAGAGFGCGQDGGGGRAEAADGPERGRTEVRADTALDRLLDEILPRVERASGFAALQRPRLARSDAERLERYLVSRLEEQLPAARAAKITAVYARLGLVPDTLDLRETLLGLYQEQVVGYYDPRLDTLFVVERLPPEQLEPVLVHELVHALQDQHVDLDSLIAASQGDNDRGTAIQAAAEGHAMLAMLEWQLGRMGAGEVDVTALPDLGERLGSFSPEALAEAAGLPRLGEAPLVIRKALLFPYIEGMSFVQRLWKAREGRPPPFGDDLPVSTEQVLHPERFVGDPRDAPARVRFISEPPGGWEEVHADGLGELEARIFLEEHLGDAARAAAGAAGWDGDAYRLLSTPGGEVFVWVSVWDSEVEAGEFAVAAREAWARRYGASPEPGAGAVEAGGRRVAVETGSASGRPAVVVIDRPAGVDPATAEEAAAARVEGG